MKAEYKISEKQIHTILRLLNEGNRVELIPLKDNIKIVQIRRNEVET